MRRETARDQLCRMQTAVLTSAFAALLSHCDCRPEPTIMLLHLHGPPLSNVDFLVVHGVSCMLQVVPSQSSKKVLLEQLTAGSVFWLPKISTSDGPRMTYQYDSSCRPVPSGARQTQVLHEGHLTPYDHMSHCANTCISNPSKH